MWQRGHNRAHKLVYKSVGSFELLCLLSLVRRVSFRKRGKHQHRHGHEKDRRYGTVNIGVPFFTDGYICASSGVKRWGQVVSWPLARP